MKHTITLQKTAVLIAALIMGAILFGIIVYAAEPAQTDSIIIMVDGQVIAFDQGPEIIDGQVLVPVRPVAEALGWNVDSNPYGIYLSRTGDIEIIPDRLFFTYYKTIIGLTEGDLQIRQYDTIGGYDIFHFKYGHFPEKNNEICPDGTHCGMIDEANAHQLTVKPILHNGRILMALEDLAVAACASVEWDINTQTAAFMSEPLPFYDGYGLPEEYRIWLLERTYAAHEKRGAINPNVTVLSADEKLRIFEAEVIRLVNEARQEHGLQPLVTIPDLTMAAQLRAVELKEKMSHTRPSGEPPASAYISDLFSYAGENIILNSMRNTPELAAKSVMANWMFSEGHRANILKADILYMGVGAAHGENGVLYAVQGFAR